MKESIKAQLIVSGYRGGADFVSNMLAMSPTSAISKGQIERTDPKGIGQPVLYEQDLWIKDLKCDVTVDLEQNIQDLVSSLQVYKDGLRKLKKAEPSVVFELSIFGTLLGADRQRLHLDASIVSVLSELELEVDIDMYPLENDQLQSNESKESLLRRLQTVKELKSLKLNSDQLSSLVDVLSKFEEIGNQIIGIRLPNLSWSELEDEYLAEEIVATACELKALDEIIHDSPLMALATNQQ